MCGIAGIWHLDKTNLREEKLRRFTDSLQHRGPDGSGYYIDETSALGLGHRRLSILDLSSNAAQPMHFAEDRYHLTYNGEIFNFIELRDELAKKGYSFRTDSDTEVILAAYHCWGKECLLKFNGMWAFAIWDSKEKELFLARDRFGIKPLYFFHDATKLFAFASETIAFKSLDDFLRRFDEKKLALQLHDTTSLEGAGHTIFDGIFQVLPGHYLVLRNNTKVQQKRWWSTLNNLGTVSRDYSSQVEHFLDLFKSSLKLRMRSDVSIATALSGGVDSSAVFCTLADMMHGKKTLERMPENWQQAFIATFPGTQSDEREFAEEVVNYTGLKGTYITLDNEILAKKVIDVTKNSDCITGSPLVTAAMIYAKMRRNGITVSMDGHGVDEMLYGYPWLVRGAYNYYDLNNDATNRGDIEGVYADLFYEENRVEKRSALISANAPAGFTSRLRKKLRNSPIGGVYKAIAGTKMNPVLQQLSDSPYDVSKLSGTEQMLFHCFHTSTLPEILRNFDRASMQSSIEVRMPFMDYRLVSFVFSLPTSSKIGHGFTKRILRDAMKGIMPENIRTRKLKVGLMAPMSDWFNNQLSELICDEVTSSSFLSSNVWDGQKLSAMATDRGKNKSWDASECAAFWAVFNAHLLQKNN